MSTSVGPGGMTASALAAMLNTEGLSYEKVARRFGVDRQTVSNYARRWGLRSRHPCHHPGKHWTVFRGRRMNLHQIAQETGIHYHTLWLRYRNGNRGEHLVRPIRKKREVPQHYELGITLADWREYADLARTVGIKTAANRTGLPYGALAAAVRGEWEKLG